MHSFSVLPSRPDDFLVPGTAPVLSDLKLKNIIQDAPYEVNGHGERIPLRFTIPKRQSIKLRECSKSLDRDNEELM